MKSIPMKSAQIRHIHMNDNRSITQTPMEREKKEEQKCLQSKKNTFLRSGTEYTMFRFAVGRESLKVNS